MKMNLWQELPKPFFVLAPMEGVTDSPFRQIIRECNKVVNLVCFTEFTSVEGMESVGRAQVTQRFTYAVTEKPLVAQIWGIKPENFKKAAQEIVKLGFDGVDINFGCPEKKVVKMGACSALINDPTKAAEIIKAVKEGVAGMVPVSVKTRIGFKTFATEEWCGFLLEQGIDALTVHGRTVKEMSEVPAHWDEIAKVVKLRDKLQPTSGVGCHTVIIGNGDVESLADAREKVAKYGVDGVMIGRGIFKNPWLFDESIEPSQKTPRERLELLLKHSRLFVETWGGATPKTAVKLGKNFEDMKKYFKIYIRDFAEAGEWRARLMECKTIEQVEAVAQELTK